MDHDTWLLSEPFDDPLGTCPFCRGDGVIDEVCDGALAKVECPLCKGAGEIAASEAQKIRDELKNAERYLDGESGMSG